MFAQAECNLIPRWLTAGFSARVLKSSVLRVFNLVDSLESLVLIKRKPHLIQPSLSISLQTGSKFTKVSAVSEKQNF